MEKKITKAVSKAAFETASVKMKEVKIYQVRPVSQGFTVYLNGEAVDGAGVVTEAYKVYRNEYLAKQAAEYFEKTNA